MNVDMNFDSKRIYYAPSYLLQLCGQFIDGSRGKVKKCWEVEDIWDSNNVWTVIWTSSEPQ